MHFTTTILTLVAGANAAVMGFNSASTRADGTPKMQADFEAEFTLAAGLEGAPGVFNSVRLYTNIQGGSQTDPLSAFPAAVATNTTMLLGIWASGTTTILNELTALANALAAYGEPFASLVVGISVGSEDLYRNSVGGVSNKAGIGADPNVIADFIQTTKLGLQGTLLANVPVGHVDTFDVWSNATNAPVLEAADFIGIDAYPFYEGNQPDNSISAAKGLWDAAMKAVEGTAAGKPVWITETGWPSSGANWSLAQPSVANAKLYWDQVGCSLFGKTNVWWYVLEDENPTDTADFSVSGKGGSTTPSWNLTCPAVDESAATSTLAGATATSTGKPKGTAGSSSGLDPGSSTGSGSKTGNAGILVPEAFAYLALAGLATLFAF
jgi:glucan endo-1,3-beta-D-glucosidase